jgi:multimeric flavodoxin WrbA
MLNILILSGSPIKDGSTEILLKQIAAGIEETASQPVSNELIRLNNYMYLPCQSCGQSPEPDYCLFQDEIYSVYGHFVDCDIVLFGSPIYFDSVSAQAKLFIDRCNCLRPYDFNSESEHRFKKILTKTRLGAMVLVGGERQEFEPARKVIAGFFKWTEIDNCGNVIYAGESMAAGAAGDNQEKLDEAFSLGCGIADEAARRGF